jgi:hypothetical protein
MADLDIPQLIGKEPGRTRHFADWTKEQLLEAWPTLDEHTTYKYRNSMAERMKEVGAAPLMWMRERDELLGLYPDVEDPDFAARLFKKTEFASLSSSAVAEDTCSKSRDNFETTAVQRLVARFFHPATPYRGLLLNHGVGVGKTCSAVTVAEMFLEYKPYSKVFILAPQAIADGFKSTIFNVNRLQANSEQEFLLTGDRWKSPQCTGMTYLRLTETAAEKDKTVIEKAVQKAVRSRYKIMGYLAFANYVESKIFKRAPDTLTGIAKDDWINAKIMEMFSDHLIIVDEAHNLRDASADVGADPGTDEPDAAAATEAAEGKKLTPILNRIVGVAEGLRLMLMTATPMYNTAPEILFLINLLILNDSKDETQKIAMGTVFNPDGTLKPGGSETLSKYFKRYISYMRGENPNTFPLRLTPADDGRVALLADYPSVSINRKEGEPVLGENDYKILENLPLVVHHVDDDTFVGSELKRYLMKNAGISEAAVSADGAISEAADASEAAASAAAGGFEISDSILNGTMQLGNMVYPDGTYGKAGWDNYFKGEISSFGATKAMSYKWINTDSDILDVFKGEGLESHSPKIAAIVKSILKAEGMSFIFSRFVMAGALPVAIALELQGWCRVLADGTPAPLLKMARTTKPKNFYVLLTSNNDISPQFSGLLKYATTFENPEQALKGSKVRAIIGSQIASEGLDLKCIRELHLLDGWYHLNRIEQIIGRGVRFCSHALLPLEKQNCLIYLHALTLPTYETADLYAYRLAVRKAQPIGVVTRLMKLNAWDCMLNRDAILLKDLGTRRVVDAQMDISGAYSLADKPFTSFCDFSDTCEYLCGGFKFTTAKKGTNFSTYVESDFRRKFLEKLELLAGIFADEVAHPLDFIKATVFEDIPWSIAAVLLREILGKYRLKRNDGIYGTLALINNYLVFQPDKVTDKDIPVALRYGRSYGRITRTIEPQRGTLLKVEAPHFEEEAPAAAATAAAEEAMPPAAASAAAAAPEAADDTALIAAAIGGLGIWMETVGRMMTDVGGRIPVPEPFTEEALNGWRWIYHHFRTLPETRRIAAKWWMDNLWTPEQKRAVLADWTIRYDSLDGDEKMWAETLKPVELFKGAGIKGFLYFDTSDLKLKEFCMAGRDKKPDVCPSVFLKDVEAAIGPGIRREPLAAGEPDDVGPVFGFLVSNKGTIVFKTLHKPTAEGRLTGAECSNDSNVLHHHPRVNEATSVLQTKAATDLIIPLLLDNRPDTAPSKKEKDALQKSVKERYEGKPAAGLDDFTHLHALSLRQICPYMEFILRYMDMKKVGGKRWFLTAVDSVRALPGGKKAIKMT